MSSFFFLGITFNIGLGVNLKIYLEDYFLKLEKFRGLRESLL